VDNASSQRCWTLILKLRGNIQLEGDLQLAEKEIAALLKCRPEPIGTDALRKQVDEGLLRSADLLHCRENGVAAYRICTDNPMPKTLFMRLTFVELVVGISDTECSSFRSKALSELSQLSDQLAKAQSEGNRTTFRLIPLNTVLEWSDVLAKRAGSGSEAVVALQKVLEACLDGKLLDRRESLAGKAFTTKVTTGQLFHGFHVYKAKFFPRMVRALLNVYAGRPDARVLDPYAGSGTALAEAAIMGMPSVGLDIDPLSTMIASSKCLLLHGEEDSIVEVIPAIQDTLRYLQTGQSYLFAGRQIEPVESVQIPPFLVGRIPDEEQKRITTDISHVLSAIRPYVRDDASPLKIALSDAISRKLKFRFLGIGVGRFSLSVASKRIADMYVDNLDYLSNSLAVWGWIRQTSGITPSASSAQLGDARAMPFESGAFDFVVTSPPYMPASSGRENYLKSKALAMTALDLIEADEIDEYERTQVGSVHRVCSDIAELPDKARDVVEWMATDEVRKIKAPSTASYFVDLMQSLGDIERVLRPGGRCAMVVARTHTFYRYKSREIVRIIENADVVGEIAERCGLVVDDAIHIELAKQNSVARPRSLDAYYETILILRKPSG